MYYQRPKEFADFLGLASMRFCLSPKGSGDSPTRLERFPGKFPGNFPGNPKRFLGNFWNLLERACDKKLCSVLRAPVLISNKIEAKSVSGKIFWVAFWEIFPKVFWGGFPGARRNESHAHGLPPRPHATRRRIHVVVVEVLPCRGRRSSQESLVQLREKS